MDQSIAFWVILTQGQGQKSSKAQNRFANNSVYKNVVESRQKYNIQFSKYFLVWLGL